jgi:hypothetical protein
MVLGGIFWITAGGDKGKIEEARERITGAVIGLAIVASSWAVFLLLNHFFGLSLVGGNNSNPRESTITPIQDNYPQIQTVCTTSSVCDIYCQNPNYCTVRGIRECPEGTVACGCYPKNSQEINSLPSQYYSCP